jgi:hypothetical protein
VRVEIRPAFDEAVRASDRPIRIAAAKTLRVLQEIDDTQLLSHPGLKFEKLLGFIEPETGWQIYSLRITQSVRATATLTDGPTVVLLALHTRHDETYRRKRR